jgi:hypothetical protein
MAEKMIVVGATKRRFSMGAMIYDRSADIGA